MFNKKIKLLLITLVFMLSISAVFASEPTVLDDGETNDSDEEPPLANTIETDSIKSVSQDNYTLETKDFSMYYKNSSRYEVTLTSNNNPVNNASIIINICGINYTRVTDDVGKATISINLNPGNYTITSNYNSMFLNSSVEVLPTISGEDITKIYRNATQYYASFLDNFGNPLTDTNVTFNINGVFYTRKTNESGIARLNINLNSGKYILTAINHNGLMYSNNITVLPSISASNLTKLYRNESQYRAYFLNSDANPLSTTNVTFNINGVFYQRTTDENGMAILNINLLPESYILTAINPVNSEMTSSIVEVYPTIITSDIKIQSQNLTFNAALLNGNNTPAENTSMIIYVDGVEYNLTTDENGQISLDLNLTYGFHEVLSVDLNTNLWVYNTINNNLYYSQYGVSPDGQTLMAIGRPSASGELSKYGYKFYKTIFQRICPYCGSDELYWGIFWAESETANYGIFEATGKREAGSAEGHIFCAHCDTDWSIFGNSHGSASALTVLSESVLSSKEDAYQLKNGEIIYNS